MNTTLEQQAVVGRRVTFTYYRDRNLPDGYAWPGIITGTEPGLSGKLRALIRLDGRRSTLSIPVDSEGLVYLDEVVPVPALPMGPFIPTADDMSGVWAGVPLAVLGEDDLILLTGRKAEAREAVVAYGEEMGIDLTSIDDEDLRACWAVFTWEPADAECPWTVNWAAAEGDEKAVRIYYLPA